MRRAVKGMESVKKLGSKDIAKLAGVSRSTVSRVINNYPNVPDSTRQSVMKVIRENHYFPQVSGQLLSGMPSRTIGLFWLSKSAIAKDSLSSQYFVSIVDAAAARGYLVLSCIEESLSDAKSADNIRKIFMSGRIDAGIFIGAENGEPLVEELVALGRIVGLFDYFLAASPSANRLTVNFERNSGARAIDFLCDMGHRDIAVIYGDLKRFSSANRHESCLQAMRKRGLEIRRELITDGGITVKSGYEAAIKMLKACGGRYPTAVYANNDAVAFGVYRAAEELGLRVPEDISVIGSDGHSHGEDTKPPLTTIGFDFDKMFVSLVNRVVDTVEKRETYIVDEFFWGNLINRESVKRL